MFFLFSCSVYSTVFSIYDPPSNKEYKTKQVDIGKSDLLITIESIQSKLPVRFNFLVVVFFLLGSILNSINKNEEKPCKNCAKS